MARREVKLIRASNMLAKYFGLTTVRDLAARVALEEVASPNIIDSIQSDADARPRSPIGQGTQRRSVTSSARLTDITDAKKALLTLIVDTSEGARTTANIIRRINEILQDGDDELRTELGRLAQIHYGGDDRNFAVGSESSQGTITHLTDDLANLSILQIMNNEGHPFINSQVGAPDKEHPGLAVILSNSTRVSLQQRFVNPIVLFLNGIPNVELQRATPIASVEFVVDRPPLSRGGRIQSISLPKFLLGAAQVSEQNTALRGMVTANSVVEQPGPGASDQSSEALIKTVGGMELFTSPQTLVNADQFDVPNAIRGNPVLDKFRPFMSLNEINISIVPSTGIMSFKTARLTFVLHDRSRLHEVAEFIRPDFYSRNEVVIEYGWSHPDGERENADNPYGDLLNGLRVREKFMIRNSSFSMDEAGQVIINLDLAMRGATDFDTEVISSDEESFGEIIREIRDLEEAVAEYRERVFPEGTTARQREIRGVQVLNAAQDARSHLTFTQEFRTELRSLRRSLQQAEGNPNAQALLDAITRLYGEEISLRRGGERTDLGRYQAAQGSAATRLRRAVVEQVTQKVSRLQNGEDPFVVVISDDESRSGLNSRERLVQDPRDRDQRRRLQEFRQQFGQVQVPAGAPVSLAKLLLHFIGEPLAATRRYDDIQMIFYPFNRYAGAARRINVGNFLVDLSYFADEYARYRLNHIGREGHMTLRQFMSFLQEIIIDDPAAPSYGLDGLFETVVSSDGTYLDTRSRFEAPDYQTRMEEKMREYGVPGGEFRMPQVDFYIEAMPERRDDEEGVDSEGTNEKTILRIHVYDRLATSYESVGSILSAARSTAITSLGNLLGSEQDDVGNSSVTHFQSQENSTAIQFARELGLVQIENRDPEDTDIGPDSTLRFVGRNNESLKQFVMSTVPYIIYGAGTTAVKNANLASMQDPRLSTVHMLRSFRRREEVRPNGEQPGGLPMRVIPTQLTMETYGCPIISFGQQFFVDFQTGTTADNIYAVVGLDHRITAGEFNSEIKFVPLDSYGRYESLVGRLSSVEAEIGNIQQEADQESGDR